MDGHNVVELAAVRVAENIAAFDGLFEGAILVPAPKSAPFRGNWRLSLWVPYRICEKLKRQRIGEAVAPALIRTQRVQKSAWAPPGKRPTASEHMESLTVDRGAMVRRPTRIVVVDDVITKGATLIACASVLRAVYPDVPIEAFAALRVSQGSVDNILEPVVGKITVNAAGDAARRP